MNGDVNESTPIRRGDVAPIEDLLDGCARGDRGSLARLYDTTAPRVYGLLSQLTDDADDAAAMTADVYHRVWTDATARPPGAGLAWLLSVAHRAGVEHRRATSTIAVTPSWLGLPSSEVAAMVVPRLRLGDDVAARLTEEEEHLLSLTYLQAHTVVQAEAALGLHRHMGIKPIHDALEHLAPESVAS